MKPALTAVERPQLLLDSWWLLTGFWYALGKDGGVVKRAADKLIEHADACTAQERKMILEDIANAIERNTAGGSLSIEQWNRVQEAMRRG